jgi:N-acetyl-anhydromuramyl-L-alanine amidase AmpD
LNIIQMSTNNQWNGREGHKPLFVILHGTAGNASAEGIADYFISTEGSNNPVSSNYVVGQDGHVVSLVPEDCGAYANGPLEYGHDPWWSDTINPNLLTISIECCNTSTTNNDVLTDVQEASLFPLIKEICVRNNIPQRKANASGGITGHFSLSPESRKDCPGQNFFWAKLWAYLQEGNKPMTKVPDGWHDVIENGKPVLYRPDRKFKVVDGFRMHILNDPNWLSANWPVENERGVAQLEAGNVSLGGGTVQTFRLGRLEWNKARNVFDCWVGGELLAVEAENAGLQTKVDALQKQLATPPTK